MSENAAAGRAPPKSPAGKAFRSTTHPSRLVPGLPLTLGYTIFYLSVLVLIPLAGTGYTGKDKPKIAAVTKKKIEAALPPIDNLYFYRVSGICWIIRPRRFRGGAIQETG